MALPEIQLSELIEIGKATLVGNTTTNLALVDGDPHLALLQASALVDLQVLAAVYAAERRTRASTSEGPDLDSWFAQFGFERLPAVKASGSVQLFFNIATGANVLVGTPVSSRQTSTTFLIIADTDNQYYSVINERYEIPAGISSITVPVEASEAGVRANTAAATLVSFPSPVTGVNAASNPLPIRNGRDREGKQDSLARFQTFIQSLGMANEDAIVHAIQTVLGATADYVLRPRVDASGVRRVNYFTIVAENGSGSLSASEIAAITTAVDRVKGYAMGFGVTAPTLTELTIVVNVTYALEFVATKSEVDAVLVSAIQQVVNTKRIGEKLYFSEVINAVMRHRHEYPIIRAVSNVTVNGAVLTDFTPGNLAVIRTNAVSIVSEIRQFGAGAGTVN